MSVMKIIEISAVSTKSFEDAVYQGLKRTSKTVHNIRSAQIEKQSVNIEEDEIKEFHAEMKVKFDVND